MSSNTDPVWDRIMRETEAEVVKEPILASFLYATILNHDNLESALSFHLAHKLDSTTASALLLREVIENAFNSCSDIGDSIRADLLAIEERDSACESLAIGRSQPAQVGHGDERRSISPWCLCRMEAGSTLSKFRQF